MTGSTDERRAPEEQARGWGFLTRCMSEMPRLGKELGKVIPAHEQTFLDLGEQVQGFASQSLELSEQASTLAEVASGEALEAFSRELTDELERFGEYMRSASSAENVDAMNAILQSMETLGGYIDSFKKVVRSLQMLGISTRIESARLGDAGRGFTTLADDVEGLAGKIVIHSARIIEKSKELTDLVGTAKTRSEGMIAARKQCSSSVFSNINKNMETLLEFSRKAESVSENVAPRSREITTSIGEVVASLQFHDITRQQVEHIQEALDDMVSIIAEEPEGGRDAERVHELVGWTGDVCSLQVSQLENAGKTFAQAVERLKHNLSAIAENAFLLGSYAEEITGQSDEGTVLDHIEASITEVIDTMRDFAHKGEQMGQLMVSVVATVSEMESFLGDIEEVGSEIELIAINAAIKAAHTGDKGQALGVLAQSIQSLSQQAGELTDSVAEALMEVSGMADVLRKSAETFMDTSQMEQDAKRLEGMIVNLRTVNLEVVEIFDHVDRLSKQLANNLERTAESISFHLEVEEDFERLREEIQVLALDAQEIVPHEEDVNRPERLKKLLDRYTMEVERLIHQAATQSAHDEDAGASEGGGSGDDAEDDWDNIELF